MRRYNDPMFTLNDFRQNLAMVRSPSLLQRIMMMLPGMGEIRKLMNDQNTRKALGQQIGVIDAMTVAERRNPLIITASRCDRIASGAGVPVSVVNEVIGMYDVMASHLKRMRDNDPPGPFPRIPH
jgi:signal recognition particle subunit SRP54